jgi:hypothetical protein
MPASKPPLLDTQVPVRVKLAALWTALMFCYVYGDIFSLYQPGKLTALLAGQTPVGPTTQGVLLGFAVLMSVPALMIILSLVLKAAVSRGLNVILGAAYALVMILAMPGEWAFYIYLGVIEVALAALIVGQAWAWPRTLAEPVT